jgi:cyanophycin synthetase
MSDQKDFLDIAGNVHLAYYVEAADILGIDYEILVYRLMARFQYKDKHWFIINTVTPLTNNPSGTIAKRKYLTNMVLEEAGIPVPKQAKLKSAEEAVRFWGKEGNVVIKPAQALGGHGITILPQTASEVKKAYKLALENNHSAGSSKVLGEKFIRGGHYRVLVVGDEVIGAVQRIPADVEGDGKSTVRQLINKENIKRRKELLKPIPIDEQTFKRLAFEGKSLEYVPKEGERVETRFHANLSAGGSTRECADEIHEYYMKIAVDAVKAIGSKFGGVDLIAEDIKTPEKVCAINEINYNPGLRPHYKVDEGKVVKVAVPIMEYIRDNF